MKADPLYDKPHDRRDKVVVTVALYSPQPMGACRRFVCKSSIEVAFRGSKEDYHAVAKKMQEVTLPQERIDDIEVTIPFPG